MAACFEEQSYIKSANQTKGISNDPSNEGCFSDDLEHCDHGSHNPGGNGYGWIG